MNTLTMRRRAATLLLIVLSFALDAYALGGGGGDRDGASGASRRGLSTDDALARVQPRR